MEKKIKDSFEVFNYFANYFIALVAIGGFVYSIIQSNQTSETLRDVKKSLSEFVQPLLVYYNYTWITVGKLSCDNVPVGINVVYLNSSLIPIKLKNAMLEVYYDNTLMCDSKVDKRTVIVESNGTTGSTIYSPQFERLRNKTIPYKEPYLEFHYTGIISNLRETVFYEINYIHKIGFDCTNYNIRDITKIKEEITLIPDIE